MHRRLLVPFTGADIGRYRFSKDHESSARKQNNLNDLNVKNRTEQIFTDKMVIAETTKKMRSFKESGASFLLFIPLQCSIKSAFR
jgi:hypothetical protein